MCLLPPRGVTREEVTNTDMCLYLSAKEGYFCVYSHVHNYMYIHVHCNQYTGKEDGVVESCVQVHIYS